jgi:predicted nucleic acid-binding Zn ribbon protein
MMEEMRSVLKNTLGKTLQTFPVEDRLEAVWRVTCGKALAEHGRVTGYSDGVLRVEVNDEAWMEQMKSLRSKIESDMAWFAGYTLK